MALSVVVPTNLRNTAINRSLRHLRRAVEAASGSEVLVIVNGTEQHGEVLTADGFRALRVIHTDQHGAAAARNLGMRVAQHDTILFTDDDCVVPPSWCSELADQLQSSQCVAVAGPVTVEVRGSITAFLDYRRVFHAPPLDAVRVRYPITANCGLRRDRIPAGLGFDERAFPAMAGGEDAEFGYALGDHGFAVRWLGDTQPVVHALPEAIGQVSQRFMRYGLAGARLYQHCGRWPESVPCAVDWYRALSNNTSTDYRRFREVVSPELQIAFATYECILTATWLTGYLREIGRALGHEIVAVDARGLEAGWQQIAASVAKELARMHPAIWKDPQANLRNWCKPPRAIESEIPIDQIAANLRENAPLTASSLPLQVDSYLRRWANDFEHKAAEERARLPGIWADIHASAEPTIAELEKRSRAAGLPLNEACHGLEEFLCDNKDSSPSTLTSQEHRS